MPLVVVLLSEGPQLSESASLSCLLLLSFSSSRAIIDAAAYVPPPPSEEQKKKIAKLAAIGEEKRLQSKKVLSQKKAFRRSRDSWD
ncbi:hypothetical protein ACLOJK_033462 [Asimina triloba]